MHRDYQSNTPIRLYQYEDRIEILNAGGLYGDARPENFPNVNDYRNPIIAEAMRYMKYVNMFNRGIQRVTDALRENGNPEPQFNVNKITAFEVVVGLSTDENLVKNAKVTKSLDSPEAIKNAILEFCITPKKMAEIAEHIGLKHLTYIKKTYINPLVENGESAMTIPDKPQSRLQKYVATKSEND